MSNSNLFRLTGWSAIASVVLSIAAIAAVAITKERGVAFTVLIVAGSVFTAVVFYGLYIFHRAQSAMASLAMLACGIVGLVLENLGTGPTSTLTTIAIGIYGVAFLLLGYLGFGSNQMPRWVAILAYAVGIVCLAITGAGVTGYVALSVQLFPLQLLVWVVWSVGIARVFLSRKLATA